MKALLLKLFLVLSLILMVGAYAHADELDPVSAVHESGVDGHTHTGAIDHEDHTGAAESPLHCGGGFLLAESPELTSPALMLAWGGSAEVPDLLGHLSRPDDPPPRT